MSTSKERPILFSGPMVRAILDGRKTQTRRVMKPQPFRSAETIPFGPAQGVANCWAWTPRKDCKWFAWDTGSIRPGEFDPGIQNDSPYGAIGNLLWVRETFFCNSFDFPNPTEHSKEEMYYRANPADHFTRDCEREEIGPWRPSIFMPRWASRITLEICDVRVQRLQSITPEDARDEGVNQHSPRVRQMWLFGANEQERADTYLRACRMEFEELWDSINGERDGCSWESNPWVWALTFRRLEATKPNAA